MSDDLPYSELSVIAGLIESNGVLFDEVTLTGEDFLDGRLADLFDVMHSMRSQQKPIDAASVGAEVPKHAGFVWSAVSEVTTTANAAYHAELVREASVRRRVKDAGVRVAQWAPELPMPDLAEKARKEIDDALGLQRRKVRFMGDTIMDTIAEIGKPSRAVPTPWHSLTDSLIGFRPGALYVIGARPGLGKTAMSLQVAVELARHGLVAYSSLEMPERELHFRVVSAQTRIAHAMLEAPRLLPEWARERISSWVASTPKRIAFDDRGTVTINDIRVHARSVSREGKLAGVVVDYLQLISGTDSKARRLEIVGEASRQLKLLARDLDVPVIALSQLNRNAESRMDKRPALADLRESGDIEQNADVVILLHRDMEASDDASDEFEMLVAKNRHGATGLLRFVWQGQFMTVAE